MDNHIKDPDAVLDYGHDWSDFLAECSDTIATSTWDVPAGMTEDRPSYVVGNTTVVWLAGGTHGTDYVVTNHMVTTAGREQDYSMKIKVRSSDLR